MKTRRCRIVPMVALFFGLSSVVLAEPSLTVGSDIGNAGDTVEVAVNFQGEGSIVALDFELNYDPNRLTPAEAVPGAISPHTVAANVVSPGKLKVLVPVLVQNPMPSVVNAVPLATFHFEIAKSAQVGVTPVTATNAIFANANGQAVAVHLFNGEVVIQ